MKISCGLIVKFEDKVLLCHPSKGARNSSFSFPKGGVEDSDNNSFKNTAIRECLEEVGIKIPKTLLSKQYVVDYHKANSSKVIKRVYLFLVVIDDLEQIGLSDLVVPDNQLQLKEVDWAGFLTKSEAASKIFWRFRHLLDEIL